MVTVTELSAMVLWASILTSFAYKMQNFPTPFYDSLSQTQKMIMRQSGKVRMKFYSTAFIVSFIVAFFIFSRLC